MELKEFIAETIKHVTDGILEGNTYIKKKSNSSEGIRSDYTKINFDIAITSNEENKGELGGKVSVVQVLNIGASNSKLTSTSSHNRIQFEVLALVKTE